MIRRVLFLLGAAAIVFGGLGLLSCVWQFGYVGSWFTIGLREGKVWYVQRVSPISDGEGFYLAGASEVNRALYNVGGGARFRDRQVASLTLGVLAAVAYALAVPPILRSWKRRAPRWLLPTLTAMCALSATLWITSHLVTVEYYGSRFSVELSDGIISVDNTRTSFVNGVRQQGWFVDDRPAYLGGSEAHFLWQYGQLSGYLPLGAALFVLLVPTITLVVRARQRDPNRCKRCDYNLTGNVSGTCPECGTAIRTATGMERS